MIKGEGFKIREVCTGSSIEPFVLRNIPGKLTDLFGKQTGGFLARMAGSNGLGASLGRAVPYVSVILVGWSIANPMGDANGAYTKSNRLSGNWIANLPH